MVNSAAGLDLKVRWFDSSWPTAFPPAQNRACEWAQCGELSWSFPRFSPTNCWSARRIPGSLASDDLSGAGSSHQGQFSSPNRGLGLKCAVSIWNLAGKMDSKFAGWNLKFVWWHSEFAHKFRFDICWMKFGINLLEFRWRHSEFSRRHSKFSWLLGFGTRIVAWIWNLPVVFVIFQVLFGIRPDLDLKFAWLDFKLSEWYCKSTDSWDQTSKPAAISSVVEKVSKTCSTPNVAEKVSKPGRIPNVTEKFQNWLDPKCCRKVSKPTASQMLSKSFKTGSISNVVEKFQNRHQSKCCWNNFKTGSIPNVVVKASKSAAFQMCCRKSFENWQNSEFAGQILKTGRISKCCRQNFKGRKRILKINNVLFERKLTHWITKTCLFVVPRSEGIQYNWVWSYALGF